MKAIVTAFAFLTIFTLFTLILGAGLLFYQSSQVVQAAKTAPESFMMTASHQGAALAVMFLFIAGAVLFLIAAAKFMNPYRN